MFGIKMLGTSKRTPSKVILFYHVHDLIPVSGILATGLFIHDSFGMIKNLDNVARVLEPFSQNTYLFWKRCVFYTSKIDQSKKPAFWERCQNEK